MTMTMSAVPNPANLPDASAVPVPSHFANADSVDAERYAQLCRRAELEPEAFWRDVGNRLEWHTPFTRVKDCSFDLADFRIRWFADGALNVAYNCLDRHVLSRGDQTALIWVADDPQQAAC